MAKYLYAQVMQRQEMLFMEEYLALIVDEVTIVDNHAWISIQA